MQKDILEKLEWRFNDTVTFNFFVANSKLSNQNYLWSKDINRTFHVVVNTRTDFARLFVKLRNLAGLLQKQPENIKARTGIALSLDTQEDIFKNKEKLQPILLNVVKRLKLWGFRNVSRDHHIPECFWDQPETRIYLDEKLKNNKITACLSPKCASWIGIDGTIRHCNQFPVRCGKISEKTTSETLAAFYENARQTKIELLKTDKNLPGLRASGKMPGRLFQSLSPGRTDQPASAEMRLIGYISPFHYAFKRQCRCKARSRNLRTLPVTGSTALFPAMQLPAVRM